MRTYEPAGCKLKYTCCSAHKHSKMSICGSKRRADIWINLTTQERTQFGPVF